MGTERNAGIIQAEIQRLLDEQTSSDPLLAEVQRLMMEQGMMEPPDSNRNFIVRALDALTPESFEELGVIGAGIMAPTLEAGQSLFQLPGQLTTLDLPTDRVADFLGRMSKGLTTRAEQAALDVGVPPQLIADSHLLGELFGFVAPIIGSLKAAKFVTGIRGPVISLSRNFKLDTAAGLIFGSTLIPEEQLRDRALNALRESALFGVGGLVLNGMVFAATGMRFARARQLQAQADFLEKLRAMAEGADPVFNDLDSGILSQLLTEETFLATTPEAQAFLEAAEIDKALVRGIMGTQEAGLTRGFVRGVGVEFTEVNQAIQRLRDQFPHLKFDAIKNPEGQFDVHFGMQGLNNQQRAQLKREGRMTGQMVQQGGATYLYLRRFEGPGPPRVVVKTIDGETITLADRQITDFPIGSEDIPVPTIGQAMYEDFRTFFEEKVLAAANASGGLTEEQIIRFIRQGQLGFDETSARAFDAPGVVATHSEIGQPLEILRAESPLGLVEGAIEVSPFRMTMELLPDGRARVRINQVGMRGTEGESLLGMPETLREQLGLPEVFTGNVQRAREYFEQARTTLESSFGFQMQVRNVSPLQGFQETFLQEGKQAAWLLDPPPIRNFDDVFQAWLRERSLTPDAVDLPAFKAHFQQRIREDIWQLAPKEDLETMRRIREELHEELAQRELPFEVLAGEKGFHVERLADDRIRLVDINTGARLTFGNEAVATESLRQIVRNEKDPMFEFITPGPHGMPGLTTGFDPSDGVFTFETNIAPHEFLPELPTQSITNVRDYLIALEEVGGIPIFREGFALADEGLIRMRERLQPVADEIAAAWKGLPRDQRKQVAEFWAKIEGTDLSGTALVRRAREEGLSNRQITALNKARPIMRFIAQELGLSESRFMSNYYGRVRRWREEGMSHEQIVERLADDPIIQREYQIWDDLSRTGELPQIELDPELVMHKYARAFMYHKEVRPVEDRIRQMMNTRIGDLPTAQREAVMRRALPDTTENSFVYPREVRDVLKEYVNNIRGFTSAGFKSAEAFTTRMFNMLGMKTDPRLIRELHSTYLSMTYGAALGLRLALMNRDATQTLWTMYTRVGGEFGTEALQKALSMSGYEEAALAGAIRETQAQVPFGDAVFNAWFGPDIAKGSGPLSNAAAAAIRKAIRAGRITRSAAKKFLVPYGSTAQIGRAWSFHWHKLHTQSVLNRFKAGDISWEKFLEDGLPFFSDGVKRAFRERMDRYGDEAALNWIGKQAADEAHFIYEAGAAPQWMQGFFGRLFGVFGQWPLWAKQLYFNRMAHATMKQKAAFWTRTAALTGAFANLSVQTGVNMWNWVAPLAFGYSGGPATDIVITARDAWSAPMDRKIAAFQRLGREMGSLAMPGQLFMSEIGMAVDAENPLQAGLLLTLGRPFDEFNYAYDFQMMPPPDTTRPGPLERSLEGFPSIGPGGIR